MRKLVRPCWVRAERPYGNETIVMMLDKNTGKTSVLVTDQWGETRTPLWRQDMQAQIASMRAELGIVPNVTA